MNVSQDATTEKLLAAEQRRAIDTLLATGDVNAAAAAAGCHVRTLQRWRQEPAFAAALQAAQDAQLDATAAVLAGATVEAVALLRRVVGNDAAQLSHRLRAAGTLLDASLRWHELRSLTQRIAALEGKVGNAAT
jgi:hypothetical protein